MAGMKRFIAYIYGYENANKAGNTGFARIELRGEECRLEIHLRSVYAAQTHCRVYLFRKQGNQMEGSLIGEMDVRNGAGDFATAMKTMHIPTSWTYFHEPLDGGRAAYRGYGALWGVERKPARGTAGGRRGVYKRRPA